MKIIVLKIKYFEDDSSIHLCKNSEVAERIIKNVFSEYCDDNTCIYELQHALSLTGIGYWEMYEKEIIK